MICLIIGRRVFDIVFCKVFSLISGSILALFWNPLASKNMIFSDHDFPCFFISIFLTFGPKWGPKSISREFTFSILFRSCSQLFPKGRFGEARGSIFDGFLMILEGFWDDFGGILGIC